MALTDSTRGRLVSAKVLAIAHASGLTQSNSNKNVFFFLFLILLFYPNNLLLRFRVMSYFGAGIESI
jgi:hypothetical protein